MKPKLDPEALSRETAQARSDPTGAFVERLRARIESLTEDGRFVKELIALEALESIMSAQVCGVSHDELKGAYPVEAWQRETVTVPADLLRVILDGWRAYKGAGAGRTFGECLSLEGGGQGKQPQRATLQAYKREIRHSRLTGLGYLLDDEPSWEAAAFAVSEQEHDKLGTSPSSVLRASQKHRARMLAGLKAKKIIE